LTALGAEQPIKFNIDLENELAVEMVIMGIMAIAWDCRTRGGMGIRFRDSSKAWRDIAMKGKLIEKHSEQPSSNLGRHGKRMSMQMRLSIPLKCGI
jgi:hypothetical protein